MLSHYYCLNIMEKFNVPKIRELFLICMTRKKYAFHYSNLKFYSDLEMKLKQHSQSNKI